VLTDAWLTIVVGFSGVVAIVVMVGVAGSPRARRAESTDVPGLRSPSSWLVFQASSRRSQPLLSFRPRGSRRSVSDNLQRALRRIDDVDPYAMQRRIGEALSDASLLAARPAGHGPSGDRDRHRGDTWPWGQVRDDHEATARAQDGEDHQ
jgi:hypothetical protein